MVAAVERHADRIWITTDNPRKEALEIIFEDMRKGISDEGKFKFIKDRKRAIALALEDAGEGDCVVIAGKGHETFQEFSDTVVPFDDRCVARDLLSLRKRGGSR